MSTYIYRDHCNDHDRDTSRPNTGTIIGASVATAIFLGLAALFIWTGGAEFGKFVWVTSRPAAPVLWLFFAAFVFVAVSLMTDKLVIAIGAVLAVLLAVFLWVKLPYDTNRQYVSSVEISDSRVPSFDERAPLRVALESSGRNMGTSAGTAQATKSLPELDVWNTAIVRKGVGVGYESVQSINVPLFGNVVSDDVTRCSFSEDAALRLGGWLPNNNMARAIFWAVPPDVSFDEADAYSYCDTEGPKVIVPLKSLDGAYAPVWKPFGAAVYNGTTGEMSIVRDVADIPGPVYPSSLAEQQRTAYQASGSWGAFLTGAVGFGDTSSDGDDPNGENNTEFGLRVAGTDNTHFVTPLTPRGESSSIIGLSMVSSDTVTPGELNPVVVRLYPADRSRVANSTVEQQLRSTYSSMADWASGLGVFEIVPSGDGEWTASLGQKQSVVYRATISADGSAVLYDADGREVTRTGTAGSVDTEATAPAGTDLSTMTPEQLQALANQILEELMVRAAK